MLCALAYVPPEKVIPAFEKLIGTVEFPEETQKVVDYFEDSWIGRPSGNTSKVPFFNKFQ